MAATNMPSSAIHHTRIPNLMSLLCLYLALWTRSICAASWTNASTTYSASSNAAQVLSSSQSPDPTSTATAEYNYFSAVESYASSNPHGLGFFGNTTYRTACPTAPHEEARSCLTGCFNVASSCATLHSSWSSARAAYQTSMNSKYLSGHGSVVSMVVSTHTDRIWTFWEYSTGYETTLTTINRWLEFGMHSTDVTHTVSTVIGGETTAMV